jgi:hypothetical protein
VKSEIPFPPEISLDPKEDSRYSKRKDDHDDYLPMEETLLQECYVVERIRSREDTLLRCSAPPPVHLAT